MSNTVLRGQRISIVGTTGSGKTTLAKKVAETCELPHVELDQLQWEPNWTAVPVNIFQERVRLALEGDRWVVDGNYSKVRDLVWSRADTVIWLNYPFHIVFRRSLQRTVKRIITQEECCNGNYESVRKTFFDRDSILCWMLTTYSKNQRKYPSLFQQPDYQHLNIMQFQSPHLTENWLSQLAIAHSRWV
ncbi:MAG: adenylate kinase [Timaviella obliquedivisa GSE-PSE-MK23-08B]|jgi:adenylate kinase family enzyme|nr:adenylate kinase [Timaviella obliquedivisa GSE-PSE-MK23-08B]